jgi:hypothetical protein
VSIEDRETGSQLNYTSITEEVKEVNVGNDRVVLWRTWTDIYHISFSERVFVFLGCLITFGTDKNLLNSVTTLDHSEHKKCHCVHNTPALSSYSL